MPQLREPRLLLDEARFRGKLHSEASQQIGGGNDGADPRRVALANFGAAHCAQLRVGSLPGADALALLRFAVRPGGTVVTLAAKPRRVSRSRAFCTWSR